MVRSSSKPASKSFHLQKPNGILSPRVQAVGPERFGIVAFDCAKERSRWLLADFYGKTLIEPTSVEHQRGPLNAFIGTLRAAVEQHRLGDLTVVIERTGIYHQPVQRAVQAAGFEARLVHPFTTKQFRLPANPDNKTDDTDLGGIVRAATQGFGLLDPAWPDLYASIQLLRRQRHDLVGKAARLQCQIRETLHGAMPGYDKVFTRFWQSPAALALARRFATAAQFLQAGPDGLRAAINDAGVQARPDTIVKLIDWAQNAPQGHPLAQHHQRAFIALDDDRREKTKQIDGLERDLASLVVKTPYALMLAVPGIGIVTVADLAGEMGPIEFYLDAGRITGRAGLFPSRYQSDRTDSTGPLVRRGNRRLRAVLMQTANNLLTHNHCYIARAERWSRQGKDPRWIRVKIAKTFTRLLFTIVAGHRAGNRMIDHLALQPRQYILGKLLKFHMEHKVAPDRMRADLEALCDQLPSNARAHEIPPLQTPLDDLSRRRGPQLLGDILPIVLARLQVVQSESRENPS